MLVERGAGEAAAVLAQVLAALAADNAEAQVRLRRQAVSQAHALRTLKFQA